MMFLKGKVNCIHQTTKSNFVLPKTLESLKKYSHVAMHPGQIMRRALFKPNAFCNGCIARGICPPTLFIKKRKIAMTTDLTSGDTISEITVKRTPNQVSAENKRASFKPVVLKVKVPSSAMFLGRVTHGGHLYSPAIWQAHYLP